MSDMTIAEFDELAEPRKRPLDSQPIVFWALGVGEEAGEFQGVIKKLEHRGEDRFGEEADRRLVDEAGDVLFYLRQTLHKRGFTLVDAADHLLKKLDGFKIGGD